MARWNAEKLNQRLEDLKARLAQGQTLDQISQAWGTTKQNVSQFRKRYLGAGGAAPSPDGGHPGASPQIEARAVAEDESLYAKAYQTIAAQDRLIQELEAQVRELKYKLYVAQQDKGSPARARESLARLLETRQG